jgi:DNA-binding transcriptional regulator YiaG
MPNIQTLLKVEIARVARKEMRTELAPLHKATSGYRRQIAALRKQVAALERMVKRQSKSTNAPATDEPDEESAHRFSAKGVKRHRDRLGLSAAQAGKLLGVSALSVYKWESGKTRPRAAQIEKLAQLRAMGKREAQSRLEELEAAPRSRKPKRRVG